MRRALMRRSPLRRLRGPLLSTTVTALATQAGLIVSGVIVARMLGPEDRGHLAFIVLIPLLIAELVPMGVPIALPYFIAREQSAARSTAKVVIVAAVAQSVLGVALHAFGLLVLLRSESTEVQLAGVITLLIVPAAIAQHYTNAVLQGLQRFNAYNVLRIGPVIAYSCSVIVPFLLRAESVVYITAALVVTTAGGAFVSLATVYRYLSRHPETSAPSFRAIVHFGLKTLLGNRSAVELYRLDQAAIGLLLTPAALGLYVVGLSFTMLPKFVAQSVGLVLYPEIASRSSPDARWAAVARSCALVAIMSGSIIAVLFVAAEDLISLFFGSEFAGATQVARILLLQAFVWSLRRVVTDGAQGLGYPGAATAAEVVSLLGFCSAVIVFAPTLTIAGIALALLMSSTASLVVLVLLVVRSRAHGSRVE